MLEQEICPRSRNSDGIINLALNDYNQMVLS